MTDIVDNHVINGYTRVFMNLGYILFFSITFPIAAISPVISGLIVISMELRELGEYKKRKNPVPIIDIGLYMDVLDVMSKFGIVACIYLIIFTSNVLTKGDKLLDDSVMHILVFMALHLIFLVRYILAEIIPDEPDWIT